MPWSGLENSKFNEFFAEKDGIADGTEHLASSLVLFRIEVVVSGLDVVVDVGAVDLNHLNTESEPHGFEEGVANVPELCDVVGADIVTALHVGYDLEVEIAEHADASVYPIVGAIVEVLHGLGDVAEEGGGILDASLKVVNMLSLKSTNEDTVDQLGHIKDSGKSTIRFSATHACDQPGEFTTAICGIELGIGCSSNKSRGEVFHGKYIN